MIRPFTCVCALLAGASGLYLYSEKHRTTLLDQQISKIVADTEHTRERTAMLRAEWALLNQPDRLQGLATRFLPQLGPMAPTQFVQLASLDKRLPAPGPETPPHPISTPVSAPGLVGQPVQAAPGADDASPDHPAADTGMAIAQAGGSTDGRTGLGTEAGTRIETVTRPIAGRHASGTLLAHDAVRPDASPARTSDAETQLADADEPTTADIVPQAALHRAAARAVAHHVAARPSVPMRFASIEHDGVTHYRPMTTAMSSSIRPQIMAAASWRPVHASWPAARPATYAVPAVGSSLGTSLGHASLPAPVPLSDGN